MPNPGKLFVATDAGAIEGSMGDYSWINEFDHAVTRPYNSETNKIQGGRRITPFKIIKEIDQMSPALNNLVCNGQVCTEVKIVLIRTAAGGEEEDYYFYTLEDARVVSVRDYMPLTMVEANGPIGHMEEVTFLARTFSWAHIDGFTYKEEPLGSNSSNT